ncbi:hypothetical protein PtA15_7A376 [Puccinia triticina]|uniref:Uncharacterized protein n=1 Tax=Puccinia triticina TaxID=208348 RepID=A0ABY7CPR6_9BASI|nr:uncharacterized protein PtA15_7A376 [Puccinia triticina]WAQ86649.1 hypothetical protein PtA15_7A376 [Puccinia triticina]
MVIHRTSSDAEDTHTTSFNFGLLGYTVYRQASKSRSVMESLGLDLLGLIASASAFSSRATVSTTELICAVLDTQPSIADAVFALLPVSSSSRSLPRPSHPVYNKFELITRKNHHECLGL